VRARTRVVIVRHAMERWKPSNTARLAALALPDSRIVEYGLADRAEPPIPTDDAVLLWPEGDPDARAGTLVVVDGSWSQARRMVQRVPALRRLPRLSLPPPPPRDRLRREHLAEGMSTLEAIARALAHLEGAAVAEPLLHLHDLHVARSREAHGDPRPRP
jgi:DTW domain-containing protein YfiP